MLTAEDLRALLDEKIDPLVQRIDTLEQRTAEPIPEPPAPEPTPDPEVEALRAKVEEIEARATAAETRAEGAENIIAGMVSGGSHRVGRSAVHLSVGNPIAAPTVFDGMCDRARSDAPTLSNICNRNKNLLLGKNGDLGRHATRSELVGFLSALCNGAEYDAIITPPGQRAGWQ